MDQVIVLESQSLFDLALQQCGGIEAVFDFAERNGLSITDQLSPGSKLHVPEVVNQLVYSYYETRQLKPATDASIEVIDSLRDEGIDFWAITVDFVVQ